MIHNDLNSYRPKYRIIFLTPEIFNQSFRIKTTLDNLYRRGLFKRIVFDEGHCITSWGSTFRPTYLEVSSVRLLYPNASLIVLTAILTGIALLHLKHLLNIHDAFIFRHTFNRENLALHVLEKTRTVTADIANLIKSQFFSSFGIV